MVPYGLPRPPPPDQPQQIPISPSAPAVQAMVQRQAGILPPPPPPSSLVSDGPKVSAASLIPAALGLGLGIIGKGSTKDFGTGLALGSSNVLLGQAQERRAQDAQKEQNSMKNVGARVEKARRLAATHPEFAAVAKAYDDALIDGKFDAKEASRISQMMDGLPDVEGLVAQRESDLAIKQYEAQQRAKAQIDANLKDRNKQDYMINGQILRL